MQDFILTIGCEYGSGGPDIAKMIAKDLGYPCYDRAIIDRIIEETGLSKEMAEKLEAGVEVRGRSQVLQNTASPSKYSILTDRVVYLQTQIIRKLADRGPCVIVGRCSDYVLRDRTDVLNAFVYAPESERLKHIMDVLKVSEEAARVLIDKNDKQLHARYKQMTGTYRGDRHNRHILIDSSVLGFEKTAKFIEAFAKQKFGG
ncbi:cytidylate kinase-like family protein [Agathobaculum sp. Marseille-P7918]|uniref:cytidylate kinase-like family protein n=1 Tax=Agathobaculum sp. Marseille-P7918 TaxID=2479843 RepID=UPI000F635EC6|nr:cytidylate kinase-like family protein [Agathobaculum sp. Marseille-P7918]